MAELTIRPEEITEALRRHVESFKPEVTREEIGRVTTVGEGVATVEGLPSTMANELPIWPLFVFGGVLTAIAAGIFIAIFLSARGEEDKNRP